MNERKQLLTTVNLEQLSRIVLGLTFADIFYASGISLLTPYFKSKRKTFWQTVSFQKQNRVITKPANSILPITVNLWGKIIFRQLKHVNT